MKSKISLFEPVIDKQEKSAILKVLRSKFWASGSGEGQVSIFEEKFKDYTGSKDCIAVNSGTAALHLALSLLDIKGKEVILPSLSFVSTAHAIIYNGGIPVFTDVDPDSLCLDPHLVEKCITKKTVAIMPVHFGGMPADMNFFKKISKKYCISIVEDAAHACGASYDRKKIGSHGNFSCFSFHPVKNLSMPTGGAICINGKNGAKLKRTLYAKRWCGITNRKNGIYDIEDLGWNYYMNEFSASIGLAQLKKLDRLNAIRMKVAKRYHKQISIENKMPIRDGCAYHLYWIGVKNRDSFRKKMLDDGIETGVHYTPIHQMSMYSGNKKLPVTEKLGSTLVSLPMHPNLSDNDVEKVIRSVNRHV